MTLLDLKPLQKISCKISHFNPHTFTVPLHEPLNSLLNPPIFIYPHAHQSCKFWLKFPLTNLYRYIHFHIPTYSFPYHKLPWLSNKQSSSFTYHWYGISLFYCRIFSGMLKWIYVHFVIGQPYKLNDNCLQYLLSDQQFWFRTSLS